MILYQKLLNNAVMKINEIINKSLIVDKKANKKLKTAKVVSERRLSLYKWLSLLLKKAGFDVTASDNIALEQMLMNLGERIAEMVIIFADGRTGSNLINFATDKINNVRSLLPNVGILVISTNSDMIFNANLLPFRTWIVTPNTSPEELKIHLLECRFAVNNNSFFLRDFIPTSPVKVSPVQNNICSVDYALPNFNIKHPAMLLPIAKAALRNNSPVYVEISPQEALVYYHTSGKDIYKKLENVFKSLKDDVEWVKYQTGAEIYLHLDHCNDAELIKRSLDLGFNSVMADGSNQTLGANIRFVKAIKELAKSYNVPVEGEVGAIDLSGYRKKSTTLCSELDIFLETTDVDYIGVNVRQFHGCDYGFDRARNAYLKLQELIQKQNYSARNLVDACTYIDNLLSEKEFSVNSLERITIKRFIDAIVQVNESQFYEIFASYMRDLPVTVSFWLNEAINEWHSRQIEIAKESRSLFQNILGYGIKKESFKDKALDFDLLSTIHKNVSETNSKIVLHGGSSISKEDLPYLNQYGIKRVNLGSKPFQLFVNAIRTSKSGKYNYLNRRIGGNPVETTFFLNEFASEWKNWIENYPNFLSEFENEIDTIFFKPLLNQFKV